MPENQLGTVLQHLRRLVGGQEIAVAGDAALVERFVRSRDEQAFAALVRRHGPLVWNVCRRILSEVHDAEDAFQATFLVLLRKAGAISRPEQLGSWLYGVAYRTALKARTMNTRRAAKDLSDVVLPAPDEPTWGDLRLVLDEELSRLPDKYRVPLVLRHLQGLTHSEAAQQLGWPVGTVSTRLARGRDLLRKRLQRRRLVFAAGALASVVAVHAAESGVPGSLLTATIAAGAGLARGAALADVAIPSRVLALTEQVLKTMWRTKWKLLAGVTLIALLGGLCLTVLAFGRTPAARDENAQVDRAAAQAPADEPVRKVSQQRLRELCQAMHTYHGGNHTLPPPATYNRQGKPMLSWRVALLSILGETDLLKQFHHDQPWDSEHNRKLLPKMPKVFEPPPGVRTKEPHTTFYQVFIGPGAVFDEGSG